MTPEAKKMQAVTSRDGTKIAYWKTGEGSPVVLVHGSISDRNIWAGVQANLNQRYTVCVMNRRGLEGSGAPQSHDLERDFEDVVAVIDAISEPVHLVGHSAGAHCALGAALMTNNVRSLVLYEPPRPGPGMADLANKLGKSVDEGRPDEAIISFVSQALTPQQIEDLKGSPFLTSLVKFAASTAVDVAALARYRFDVERFSVLDIPVLLLVGGESGPRLREVNEALAQVLPHAQFRELPGQQHMANLIAPELFTSEVLTFLETVEEKT